MILRRNQDFTDMKGFIPLSCFPFSFQLEAAPAFVHYFALFCVVLSCYNEEMASNAAPWESKGYVPMGRTLQEEMHSFHFPYITKWYHSIGVWMKLLQISPKEEMDPTGRFSMQREPTVSGISLSILTLWACGDWWWRLTKRENPFKAVLCTSRPSLHVHSRGWVPFLTFAETRT